MPSFLADLPQTPLERESGHFLWLNGVSVKLRGHRFLSLLSEGYIEEDASLFDPKYPNRRFYNLLRFTAAERSVILCLVQSSIPTGSPPHA